MKLEIVCGYVRKEIDGKLVSIKAEDRLVGKKFNSFRAVVKELNPNETVTVQGPMGFKEVGIDDKGVSWVQRYWATEY